MSNSPIPRTGVYRSSYGPPTPSPLPLLWDDALDSLIRRTLRAYFLITSYERDSHGGTRWSSEDIAHIEAVGKYLPENVRVLDDWQHTIGREGEKDASTMGKIRYGAEQVRRCCEQIQGLIETTERIPIIQRITRGSPERGDQSDSADINVAGPRARGKLVNGMKMDISTDLSDRKESPIDPIDPIDAALRAAWATTFSTTRGRFGTFDSFSLAEIEDSSFRPSMLWSILPTVVSNRLPAIPSLRQSLIDVRSRSTHSKCNSVTELPHPETPPPGYSSIPPSGSVTPHRLSVALGEAEFDLADNTSERPGSSRSTLPPLFDTPETSTGIRWKYASLGTSLMAQASRESNTLISSSDETSTRLTRQLYMHGMTYLLRGLPAQLTQEEMLSLQAALPQGLETKNDLDTNGLLLISQRDQSPQRTAPQDVTLLHRITATIVLQSFIIVQLLLPYIKLFLSHTYQFERKHQITKRLVNTGVTTVDELGRRSLRLSQTVCQMNDGMVGQAINEMTIWWVRGVTGGVQEGLADGLKALRCSESSRRGQTMERTGT
ncbi:hypothetical protein BDW02DRAFT_598869 [Decorospora gaudefroyi]|uniref:Uncharacterized protein n=1 Tax=Decorospora gaudefroyi TaxID=184978 RepID=A0A6A5KC30_9PLEO|nr:hypothetical protein BDW02DRAFT_598869 [Decorospora gaudefroyi]